MSEESNLFKFHKLNDKGIEKAQKIQEIFEKCLVALEQHCEEGREFSIAKTKLEESCFFAKKSMAVSVKNRE
jgi:hypothetical protein